MKIVSKIMRCTQHFVIPYSVEELNKAVKDNSFIDVIQSAQPLVNTYVTPGGGSRGDNEPLTGRIYRF